MKAVAMTHSRSSPSAESGSPKSVASPPGSRSRLFGNFWRLRLRLRLLVYRTLAKVLLTDLPSTGRSVGD